MSNSFSKHFLAIICIFSLFVIPLTSKEENDVDKNDFEVGFRLGRGFKAKDQFDENLQNFRSFDSPNIYTYINVSGFHNFNNGEVVFRRRWSPDVKFGFAYGFNQYEKIQLTEIASDGYITRLNFNIATNYFVATYHTEWIFRNFFLEGGIGIGINETSWKTTGFVASRNEFQNQKGYLSGNGIQYKLEGSFNKKITDVFILQIGLSVNYSSVPSFSGSLNGQSGTYFITRDGKVNSINQSDYSDNYLWYNSATRRLDFFVGGAVLYFSILGRFSI